MARRPGSETGQPDLFGHAPAPAEPPRPRTPRRPKPAEALPPEGADEASPPEAAPPEAAPAKPRARRPAAEAPPPEPPPEPAPPREVTIEEVAARLTPAGLDALAASLPDEALAQLVALSVRAARRRLARIRGRKPDRGAAALARALAALAAELRDPSADD